MTNLNWIKSDGGPLICIEARLSCRWCGNEGGFRSGSCSAVRPTDYERACERPEYLGLVAVEGGTALILGDAPLETTAWIESKTLMYIARLVYADKGEGIERAIADIRPDVWNSPEEVLRYVVETGPLTIFDSALRGEFSEKDQIMLAVEAGLYEVRTSMIQVSDNARALVHRFKRMMS